MNRLKLYDNVIYTYIEKSDKNKFKKIAFKNKMTISEFNRYLIKLAIKIYEANQLDIKQEINIKKLESILNNIRRDI